MTTTIGTGAVPQPAPGRQRIIALDAIRGLATLGVLFAYAVWNLGNPPRETWNAFDRVIGVLFDVFVDVKFLTMFAFLFGMGIAQQWRRWESVIADPALLHVRRMLFLLAIGLADAFLLRSGDILAPYALLGLVVLLFRGWSTRALLLAVGVLFVAPYVIRGLILSSGVPWPARPTAVSGSFLADNLAWVRYWYATNPITIWPGILSTILLGFVAGRVRLVERLAADRVRGKRSLIIAAASAVVTWLALAAVGMSWRGESVSRGMVLNAIYQLNALAFAAAYGAAVLVLARRSSRVVTTLQSLGRLAFTNYLVQALILVPFCLATGLVDHVAPGRGLLLAMAVGAIQVAFSQWWLRHHEMGPFERLWRNATYGAEAGEPTVEGTGQVANGR